MLERYQPYLRYDSHEAYFADDAAIFTDGRGNTLPSRWPGAGHSRRRPLAGAAQPRPIPQCPAAPWAKADVLSIHDKKYRERAAELHMQPRYANVAYGHVAQDSREATWLQYWTATSSMTTT